MERVWVGGAWQLAGRGRRGRMCGPPVAVRGVLLSEACPSALPPLYTQTVMWTARSSLGALLQHQQPPPLPTHSKQQLLQVSKSHQCCRSGRRC